MTESNDDDLRRAFAEWREDDAQAPTPGFDATLARAQARPRTPRRIVIPMAWRAAAALMLVAGAGWLVRRSRAPDVSTTVSLTAWRSPTAFLLDAASDPLLTSTPSFSTDPRDFGTLGIRAPNRSNP
jgi:hypothetical protein